MPCFAFNANKSDIFCSSAFFSSLIRPSSDIDLDTSAPRAFLNSSTWTIESAPHRHCQHRRVCESGHTVDVHGGCLLHRLDEPQALAPYFARQVCESADNFTVRAVSSTDQSLVPSVALHYPAVVDQEYSPPARALYCISSAAATAAHHSGHSPFC
jgi:hypothetical protein